MQILDTALLVNVSQNKALFHEREANALRAAKRRARMQRVIDRVAAIYAAASNARVSNLHV